MKYQWRDPEPLGRAVILWLWLWLVAQTLYALSAGAYLVELSMLPTDVADARIDSPDLTPVEWAAAISAVVFLPVWLASAYLTLKWIYRVNANAQTLSGGISVSPGWNVGFFFIPFANLFKPYQGIREAWQVSHDPARASEVEVPSLLPVWWGLWLVTTIMGNVSMRLSFSADTAAPVMTGLALDLAGGILSVPLGLLLIRIVRRLTSAQVTAGHTAAFA